MRKAPWGALACLALAGCQSPGTGTGKVDSVFQLLGPPSPAAAARDMVDPFDPDKRYRGMSLIAAAPFGGEDVYLNVYTEAIKTDTDPGVRAVAARALGMHGRPEHALLITPLLASDDKRIRLEGARALQRLHNPEAIGPLARTLVGRPDPDRKPVPGRPAPLITEPDKDVRAAAAEALGQYADASAAKALIGALADDDLVVVRTAHAKLQGLTGQTLGPDARAWTAFMAQSAQPFAQRRAYTYPAFSRKKYTWEHLPLFPDPPNEASGNPAGYELPQ